MIIPADYLYDVMGEVMRELEGPALPPIVLPDSYQEPPMRECITDLDALPPQVRQARNFLNSKETK